MKKVISIIMSIGLIMSFLPMTVLANENWEVTVEAENEVVEQSNNSIYEVVSDDIHNTEATIPCSGVTNGITWSVDAKGNLTATGTMGSLGKNYEVTYLNSLDYQVEEDPITENECPWISVKDKIVTAKVSVKNAYGILTWFRKSESLKSVDLTGTELGTHGTLGELFYNCKKLEKVNFGDSFDTSKVTSMWRMFRSCQALKEVKGMENFNTANVREFNELFFDCIYLEKVDLSNFDASSANIISYLVNSCYNLTDFKFFKKNTTGSICEADAIFGACTKLKSIDLSGCDFNSLYSFYKWFIDCKALESIDLSEAQIGALEFLENGTFKNCNSLKKVSFKGAKLNSLCYIGEFFEGCPNLQFVDMSDCSMPSLGNTDLYKEATSSTLFGKDCINIKEFHTPYGFPCDILFGDNYKGSGTTKFKDETGKEYNKLSGPLEKSVVLKRDGGYTGTNSGNTEATKPLTPANTELGDITFSLEAVDTSTKAANGKIIAKVTKPVLTYTGKELKPTVSVSFKYSMYENGVISTKVKNKKLKKDVDYTISYENNINATENGAFVVLEGKGAYNGTIKLPFTIKKRAAKYLTMDVIPDVALSADEFSALNDGDNEKSGALQKKVYETIKKTVSENTVVYDGARTISGNQYSYEISSVKVKKNIKSVVIQIIENKEAKDEANYTFEKGAVKAKTTVYLADEATRNNIAECTVNFTTVKSYVSNGKLIKPKVTVTDKSGKKLASKNYKILYRNNVNPGTATAYVIGKGAYIGISSKLNFNIAEKSK